ATGFLQRVDFSLFCASCTNSLSSLTLSIRATNNGLPTGPDLAAATIPQFSSGSASFYTILFPAPTIVNAGTKYAIIVRANAAITAPATYDSQRSDADVYTVRQ